MANVKLTAEERRTVVDGLIANSACCWEESDRKVLNSMNDVTLAKLYYQQELIGNADDDDTKKGLPSEGASEAGASTDQLDKDENEDVDVEEEDTKPGDSQATGKDKPMGEENPKPNTNALSLQDRRDLAFARKYRMNQRRQHIEAIVANERNPFTVKQLSSMSDKMLTNMAQLAQDDRADDFDVRYPSFLGAAAGVVTNVGVDEDPLPLPSMDYTEAN